jgi:hypothetical protein
LNGYLFFVGGAFGSLVILGIDYLFSWITNRRLYQRKKALVMRAVQEEIKSNLKIYNDIINTLTKNPTWVGAFGVINST